MFFLLCVLCYYVYLSWIFISYFLCFDCLVLVSCMLCMTTIFSRYFIYLCELFLFVLLGVFFFFYKQKTAYDWRIGDWSSDVCSSDLGPGTKYETQGGFDPSDLFSELFGDRGGRAGARGPRGRRRGADASMRLTVDFVTAATGGSRRVTLPSGRSLDLRIPVGTATGQILRLAGQGMAGSGGGPAGRLLIELDRKGVV